jgi:hypothetical protein
MNDLMSRMLFGTMIAKKQGLSQNEAFKVGLLSGMDNSQNSFMPLVTAKMMADDKVKIHELQKSGVANQQQTTTNVVSTISQSKPNVVNIEITQEDKDKFWILLNDFLDTYKDQNTFQKNMMKILKPLSESPSSTTTQGKDSTTKKGNTK